MKKSLFAMTFLFLIGASSASNAATVCDSENGQVQFVVGQDILGRGTLQLVRPLASTFTEPKVAVSYDGIDTTSFTINALPLISMQGRYWTASEGQSVNGRVTFVIRGVSSSYDLICQDI